MKSHTDISKEDARDRVLTALDDVGYSSVGALAEELGITPRAVQRRLTALQDEGAAVERIELTLPNGGKRGMWRKVPEGYVAPLYDPQPGVDARALDRALGGFTFSRKQAATI